jgi:hypothetical protein
MHFVQHLNEWGFKKCSKVESLRSSEYGALLFCRSELSTLHSFFLRSVKYQTTHTVEKAALNKDHHLKSYIFWDLFRAVVNAVMKRTVP